MYSAYGHILVCTYLCVTASYLYVALHIYVCACVCNVYNYNIYMYIYMYAQFVHVCEHFPLNLYARECVKMLNAHACVCVYVCVYVYE
jgi:hypothetical protein